jgi:hypothetical protein
MESPIYQWLSNDSAITALVGDRIYGSGFADQQSEPPWEDYIAIQLVATDSPMYLGRYQDVDYERAQIHCWSQSEARAQQIMKLCRAALDPYGNHVGGAIEDYDPDVKMYRCGFDYGGWEDRT